MYAHVKLIYMCSALIGGINMRRITSILFICILVLTGCTAKEKETMQYKTMQQEQTIQEEVIKNVYVKTIGSSGYSDKLTLSGNIVPTQTVKLSFKIPGIVSNVLVNEGDVVVKGQVIATMDQSDYSIKVRAAEAELEAAKMQIESEIPAKINQAKAQYDLTKVSYERAQNLFEQDALPQAQLDEITAKLTVDENTYNQAMEARAIAETKLQMAQAALDGANANIEDTTIYSPINGVVLQKIVQQGETTSAGYPIVAIGQMDKVWAQIGVPDEFINALKVGQKANIYVYGIDQSVEGTVDEINALADVKTRTFPVKILIDNLKEELKPGMISKVDISLSHSDKILIPLSSVMHLSKGEAVYIYSGETQTVSKRIIETGEILKDQIEVVSGLEAGEKLVVEGQFVLRTEDKVIAEELTK